VTHHGEVTWLAQRWKALAALSLTLLGAVAQTFPNSTGVHAAFGFATMVLATFGVHQVENAVPPPEPVVAADAPSVVDTA
jgi:hypothetical protein